MHYSGKVDYFAAKIYSGICTPYFIRIDEFYSIYYKKTLWSLFSGHSVH